MTTDTVVSPLAGTLVAITLPLPTRPGDMATSSPSSPSAPAPAVAGFPEYEEAAAEEGEKSEAGV